MNANELLEISRVPNTQEYIRSLITSMCAQYVGGELVLTPYIVQTLPHFAAVPCAIGSLHNFNTCVLYTMSAGATKWTAVGVAAQVQLSVMGLTVVNYVVDELPKGVASVEGLLAECKDMDGAAAAYSGRLRIASMCWDSPGFKSIDLHVPSMRLTWTDKEGESCYVVLESAAEAERAAAIIKALRTGRETVTITPAGKKSQPVVLSNTAHEEFRAAVKARKGLSVASAAEAKRTENQAMRMVEDVRQTVAADAVVLASQPLHVSEAFNAVASGQKAAPKSSRGRAFITIPAQAEANEARPTASVFDNPDAEEPPAPAPAPAPKAVSKARASASQAMAPEEEAEEIEESQPVKSNSKGKAAAAKPRAASAPALKSKTATKAAAASASPAGSEGRSRPARAAATAPKNYVDAGSDEEEEGIDGEDDTGLRATLKASRAATTAKAGSTRGRSGKSKTSQMDVDDVTPDAIRAAPKATVVSPVPAKGPSVLGTILNGNAGVGKAAVKPPIAPRVSSQPAAASKASATKASATKASATKASATKASSNSPPPSDSFDFPDDAPAPAPKPAKAGAKASQGAGAGRSIIVASVGMGAWAGAGEDTFKFSAKVTDSGKKLTKSPAQVRRPDAPPGGSGGALAELAVPKLAAFKQQASGKQASAVVTFAPVPKAELKPRPAAAPANPAPAPVARAEEETYEEDDAMQGLEAEEVNNSSSRGGRSGGDEEEEATPRLGALSRSYSLPEPPFTNPDREMAEDSPPHKRKSGAGAGVGRSKARKSMADTPVGFPGRDEDEEEAAASPILFTFSQGLGEEEEEEEGAEGEPDAVDALTAKIVAYCQRMRAEDEGRVEEAKARKLSAMTRSTTAKDASYAEAVAALEAAAAELGPRAEAMTSACAEYTRSVAAAVKGMLRAKAVQSTLANEIKAGLTSVAGKQESLLAASRESGTRVIAERGAVALASIAALQTKAEAKSGASTAASNAKKILQALMQ